MNLTVWLCSVCCVFFSLFTCFWCFEDIHNDKENDNENDNSATCHQYIYNPATGHIDERKTSRTATTAKTSCTVSTRESAEAEQAADMLQRDKRLRDLLHDATALVLQAKDFWHYPTTTGSKLTDVLLRIHIIELKLPVTAANLLVLDAEIGYIWTHARFLYWCQYVESRMFLFAGLLFVVFGFLRFFITSFGK